MKIFLDSIDLHEIIESDVYGIIEGITTNPSLLASSDLGFYETIKKICASVQYNVSVETPSDIYQSMIEEGNKILTIAKNIVIKLPMTWDGIRACKYFIDNGYQTNMTLCFTVNQAILAAKVGATYISPFVGRLNDIGSNGIELVSNISCVYKYYKFKTKILAASIRTTEDVSQCAIHGADIVTVPGKLFLQLIQHSLTSIGVKKFKRDWRNSGMSI